MSIYQWLSDSLDEASALIIVPPFGSLDWPCLGPHVLEAVARPQGFRVRIVYANLLFAARIGLDAYQAIAGADRNSRLGDRVFCQQAFECLPILGKRSEESEKLKQMEWLAEEAGRFCEELARAIVASNVKVVGCTTTFDQTISALALLRHVKSQKRTVVTILGGANCEGQMGVALAAVAPIVDHIFQGEAEHAFVKLLATQDTGDSMPKLIHSSPCLDLEIIPCPDYSDYFFQRSWTGLNLPDAWLTYETSRGCWWGMKQHCTFCGLNGENLTFRFKRAERVIEDILKLRQAHGNLKICMTDNIMPHRYHRDLVPNLAMLSPRAEIFYEQKANLTLSQVDALAKAGIKTIQPGIESLSTSLLRRIRKGVSAGQNIALLRHCLICGITPHWNLLYGLPGDRAEEYIQMKDLMNLIPHLPPPSGLSRLSIDRFSPYFEQPEIFGISNIRPLRGYADVWPESASVKELAYHFYGDYESESAGDLDLFNALESCIDRWKARWNNIVSPPRLCVLPIGHNELRLLDARDVDRTIIEPISIDQARATLWGTASKASLDWASANGYVYNIDGRWVGLATSDIDLIRSLYPREVGPGAMPVENT